MLSPEQPTIVPPLNLQDLLDSAEARAITASAEFIGVEPPSASVMAAPRSHAKQLMHTESGVRAALAERYRANADNTGKAHDMKVSYRRCTASSSWKRNFKRGII